MPLKALALLLLFVALPASAQMYKCVDERGVTHYTDKPRPDCKGGKVDIRPIPSISGKGAPASRDLASQDADFKRRQIERDEAQAKDKAALDQRCARLRREVSWLSHGGRITYTDAQGKREFIDDAQRDVRLGQLREQLRLCP